MGWIVLRLAVQRRVEIGICRAVVVYGMVMIGMVTIICLL